MSARLSGHGRTLIVADGSAGGLTPGRVQGADGDALTSLIERDGQVAGKDSNTARRIADLLRSLAAGQVPGWVADQTLKEALERLTRSAQVSPPAFDQVAARWDKLAGGEDDEVIYAPSLLLGLARLCAACLTKDTTDPVLFPGTRPIPGERLVLRVQTSRNGKVADLPLALGQWDEQTRETIRVWLRDAVLPGLESRLSIPWEKSALNPNNRR